MPKPTVVTVALLLAASAASAQAAIGRYDPAKGSAGPQRGVQTKREPAQVVVVRPNPSSATTYYATPVPTPVAVRLVPAVIMSDGSILADFGFGLEQVRRPCAGAVVSSGGRVIGGNGQVLSQPAPSLQPVPRLQPVPGMQPAPGMQAAPTHTLTQRQLSRAALGSCFTRDASGRVFVTQ